MVTTASEEVRSSTVSCMVAWLVSRRRGTSSAISSVARLQPLVQALREGAMRTRLVFFRSSLLTGLLLFNIEYEHINWLNAIVHNLRSCFFPIDFSCLFTFIHSLLVPPPPAAARVAQRSSQSTRLVARSLSRSAAGHRHHRSLPPLAPPRHLPSTQPIRRCVLQCMMLLMTVCRALA